MYCWHALAAYWAGVSHQAAAMQRYKPALQWPEPDAGILEVDPSLAWSSKVLGGVSIAKDSHGLHDDMHAYLQGEPLRVTCAVQAYGDTCPCHDKLLVGMSMPQPGSDRACCCCAHASA